MFWLILKNILCYCFHNGWNSHLIYFCSHSGSTARNKTEFIPMKSSYGEYDTKMLPLNAFIRAFFSWLKVKLWLIRLNNVPHYAETSCRGEQLFRQINLAKWSHHVTKFKKRERKKMWYLHVEPVYYQATRHGILLPGSSDCRK